MALTTRSFWDGVIKGTVLDIRWRTRFGEFFLEFLLLTRPYGLTSVPHLA